MKLSVIVAVAAATAAALLFSIVDCQSLSKELLQQWAPFANLLNVLSKSEYVNDTARTSLYIQAAKPMEKYKNKNPKMSPNGILSITTSQEKSILVRLDISKCNGCSKYENHFISHDLEEKCHLNINNTEFTFASWARSALVAAEYSLCRNNGNNYTVLSLRQITSCFMDLKYSSPYVMYDSDWIGKAMEYMKQIGGLKANEKNLTKFYERIRCPVKGDARFVAEIIEYNGRIAYSRHPGVLESIVYKDNVVSVAMKVNHMFFFYSAGIYSHPMCNAETLSYSHAVSIVGYGTDKTYGLKFWKALNFWNVYDNDTMIWGENGYFNIERGINMCGIETYAYTIKVGPIKKKKDE